MQANRIRRTLLAILFLCYSISLNAGYGFGQTRERSEDIVPPKEMLSTSQFESFRKRIISAWKVPRLSPREIAEARGIVLRIRLNPDGTLSGPPYVVASENEAKNPEFIASAMNAVSKAQPFRMFPMHLYEQWKEIELAFRPQK